MHFFFFFFFFDKEELFRFIQMLVDVIRYFVSSCLCPCLLAAAEPWRFFAFALGPYTSLLTLFEAQYLLQLQQPIPVVLLPSQRTKRQ
jgi:hypothetical protein